MIPNAAGYERGARLNRSSAIERRLEALRGARKARHARITWLDTVYLQLRTSNTKQFERRCAVAAQVPVQRKRSHIAWLCRIAQHHLPATATEYERRAQSSWTAADDNHVKHARRDCKAGAMEDTIEIDELTNCRATSRNNVRKFVNSQIS